MNTKQIRKTAIALLLGEILTHSCMYSPETQARWDSMEPDIKALEKFQIKLATLACQHFKNELNPYTINEAITYCYEVGQRVGHVLLQGLTGTWGVRIGQLQDILKIMQIPDFELLPIGSIIQVMDFQVKITNYRCHGNWLVVSYEPMDEEQMPWGECVYWNDLQRFKKE